MVRKGGRETKGGGNGNGNGNAETNWESDGRNTTARGNVTGHPGLHIRRFHNDLGSVASRGVSGPWLSADYGWRVRRL